MAKSSAPRMARLLAVRASDGVCGAVSNIAGVVEGREARRERRATDASRERQRATASTTTTRYDTAARREKNTAGFERTTHSAHSSTVQPQPHSTRPGPPSLPRPCSQLLLRPLPQMCRPDRVHTPRDTTGSSGQSLCRLPVVIELTPCAPGCGHPLARVLSKTLRSSS